MSGVATRSDHGPEASGVVPDVGGEILSAGSLRRRQETAARDGRLFLKGPVPLPWLVAAAGLGGKALHVAVAPWFRIGLEGTRTVRLGPQALARFGIGRTAGYRALAAFEAAGLIVTERRPGRAPRVTALDAPGPAGRSATNRPPEAAQGVSAGAG